MLVFAVVAGAATAALAARSPKAVSNSILAAARAQSSVHYVTHDVVGSAALTFSADVAADHGIQHVSIKVGKNTGHITIVVVSQTAYVTGDAFGLQALQQLTQTQASTYAGQWISIPSADKDFKSTAADVTLGSEVTDLAPHGHLQVASGKVKGTKVVAIRAVFGTGKKRTVEILDAHASGKPLPIEEVAATPGEETLSHSVFTHWNEVVSVQAPATSVPIATVRGG